MINKFNILLLFLILLLIIFTYQNHKSKQVEEHFADYYIKDFKKYIENIRISNQKKQKSIEKEQKIKKKKYKSLSKVKQEKILITGATSGLGLFVAKYVNRYNCKLFVTARDKTKVDALVEELKKTNSDVYGFATDFTKEKGIERLFKEVTLKIKNVSILFNCANTRKGKRFFINKKEKDWRTEMDVNVNSVIILTMKVSSRMSLFETKGRIINFSTFKSKNNKMNYNDPDKVILENMIEKFSSVFSQELYEYGIAITTIRLDEDFNFGKKSKIKELTNFINPNLTNTIMASPKKLKPVLDYVVRAPNNEISGKVISTDNFSENKELINVVSPNKLKNDYDIFDNATITKTIPRDKMDNVTTLTKQNPFPHSSKVRGVLSSDKVFNKFNTMGKYDSILDNVIAKKLNIKKKKIVFFKTEFDAIKKLLEIFVSKGNEVLTTNPPWSYLELATVENKNKLQVVTLKNTNNKELDINYNNFKFDPKTKMVYLSSPNIVSGQCIRENSRWNEFLDKIPDNVILVIDERYIEFVDTSDKKIKQSSTTPILDSINLLKKRKNTIILRSFNNYYSIENLELAYIITDTAIANLIKNSQLINPLDRFIENLALTVINDPYYKNINTRIAKERNNYFKILDKHNIDFYDSDSNFFLIQTNSDKEVIMNDFENDDIILYNSNDGYNNYWTLPISDPETNKKVIDLILYDNMENMD